MLLNNPGTSDALARMVEIFRNEVASAYGEDWLLRSVYEKYLPAHVMSPPSSPIKRKGPSQQHPTTNTPNTHTELPPLPTLSSVSITTSLTESAVANLADDSPPPTPKIKVRHACTSAHRQSHAAPPSATHNTKPSIPATTLVDGGPSGLSHQQLPTLLTLSSTV